MRVKLINSEGGFYDGPAKKGYSNFWEVAIVLPGNPDIRLASAWNKAEAIDHAIGRIETMLAGLKRMMEETDNKGEQP